MEFGENGARKAGDVEIVGQGLGERFFACGLGFDLLVASEFGGFQEVGNIVAGVLRNHGEGIAGFVAEAGIGEGKFDVDRFLGSAFAVEQDVFENLGREGILQTVAGNTCGGGGRRFVDNDRAWGEGAESSAEPVGECVFVVDIAVLARCDALGAESFQFGIDVFAGLAEFFVGSIAQGADREQQATEFFFKGHEVLVKFGGTIGRFAVAPCADDHEQVAVFFQVGRGDIRHVFHGRADAFFLRFLRGAVGKFFRVARLGSIQNQGFYRSGSWGGNGAKWSSEKAREPSALGGIEPDKCGFDEFSGGFGEWSVRG